MADEQERALLRGSGGGGSLPPLIQVEPYGGAGQHTYSVTTTASQPIVTQLDSFLIPQQPASTAAVAVVSAPAPAAQVESYGVQQAPASTSSQYSLIDAYGLQASVYSPAPAAPQQPARPQLGAHDKMADEQERALLRGSGGGGSLPPLIQVEPYGGAGQHTYSVATTASQPIVTQLESFLIPQQPATTAAVAVVSAPAVQLESYGVQQAPPSTSSQYSLIDGYGLQASVYSPAPAAPQQPARQQLAAQPSTGQVDSVSYGASQVGSMQQGPAPGQYGTSPQQYRDDKGSTNPQQAVGQYGNPPVNNQQFRDDGGSNMLQQGQIQGHYVNQPVTNSQYRDERGSYGPESVNQRHNAQAPAPSGSQQHQSTMAVAATYPPQPEGSTYASPGVAHQGAPTATYQLPQVGAPPFGNTGTLQHSAPAPQYTPALPLQPIAPPPQYPPQYPQQVSRQPSLGQHPEPSPGYVATGHQHPSYTATPVGQPPPPPHYTPAHTAPYPPPGPPPGQPDTSFTTSTPNPYAQEQPKFAPNAPAQSPYPPQPSDPPHGPQGAAPYPPHPTYSQIPTPGIPQTTSSSPYTPYPPYNQQSQPVYPPTPYGVTPTPHQPPYGHQTPPYSPGHVQSQQNQQSYPPAPPTYPPAPPHPQAPLSRSSSGSYVPPYPPNHTHGGPGQQNPHYGPGAPPPTPYPPHPSQVYAPGAPAYTSAVLPFDRSFSLDYGAVAARPPSPPVERNFSGHLTAASHSASAGYGVYQQSGLGFGGKGPAHDQSASGNQYQGSRYETRLYEDRPAFGGSDRYSEKSMYDNAGYSSSEVFAYDGGRSEPYGARGSGSWGVGSGTAIKSASYTSYGNSGGKLVKAVPKTDSDDVGGGIQKYRVKLLSDSSSSGPKDVICQIGLDGVKMVDPSTNRMLRIYPLDTITRWEVNEPSVFTFWSKSAVDVEQRSIKLQSSSNTTTAILDTLTAACVQLSEMVGRDGRTESKPSSAVAAADTSQQKKTSFADWVQIKTRTSAQEEKQHWVPDEAVTKCTGCDADFGAFNRRHHCRNCGDLFCDKCTRGRTALNTDEDAQSVRVCDRCLAEVTQRLANIEVLSKAPAPRTHEDLARKLQEEMERNSKKGITSSNGNQSSNSRSSARESKASLYPETTPQAWPSGSSAEKTGGRMKEVACPTCTVHLQVPVPSYGSETLECSVCQHPFLVHAN